MPIYLALVFFLLHTLQFHIFCLNANILGFSPFVDTFKDLQKSSLNANILGFSLATYTEWNYKNFCLNANILGFSQYIKLFLKNHNIRLNANILGFSPNIFKNDEDLLYLFKCQYTWL